MPWSPSQSAGALSLPYTYSRLLGSEESMLSQGRQGVTSAALLSNHGSEINKGRLCTCRATRTEAGVTELYTVYKPPGEYF